MRLMISVVSAVEAQEAILGGAEILDVKNPEEGSLGAQFPRVIRKIKDFASGIVEISAAIGDMPNLPGTAALAALGAAACGVDYVKVGRRGIPYLGHCRGLCRLSARRHSEPGISAKPRCISRHQRMPAGHGHQRCAQPVRFPQSTGTALFGGASPRSRTVVRLGRRLEGTGFTHGAQSWSRCGGTAHSGLPG
jgi:hypothetical protein